MSSPSSNSGVHRRRPSLLVTTPSSIDIPGLSSTTAPSLHSNSSGSLHQQQMASPQAYTPTAASGGGPARRRRASSTNEPTADAGSSTSSSRGKKGSRRSTGHSEHVLSAQAYLATPDDLADSSSCSSVVSDAAGSSTLGPPQPPAIALAPQPREQPLNPYLPSPGPSLSQPPPVSSTTGSYGQYGLGPTLRTLPASSARKGPPLRTSSSSSSSNTTAIQYPASPTRSGSRVDDLVPVSPGSGYLPSHAGGGSGSLSGQGLLYGSGAVDGGSSALPPYSVNPTTSSSSSHSLSQLLPSLPLPSSVGHSGFNTAYQTAQTSPTLAVSLQMESGSAYPGHSRFFDSTPSSPRPSTSTASEPDERDHGHGAGTYGAFYPPPSTLEKLLPTKDDVREKATEWRRWWKRRNSRSYSGSRPGSAGILSTSGSAADRKKRRKRAGTGVGGSMGGSGGSGGARWWRRFRPERKRGWLTASILAIVCLWSFVNWMFWVFNPDKTRIEYRPQCISPYPSYHALSSLSPETLQRIPLPSVGSPLHPLLPQPLLAPSSLESDKLPPVGVFVGVFSTDQAFERRMLIRSTWASGDVWRGKQGEGLASTRVRFILGMPRGKWKELVRTEMETYGDIVILEVRENMNSGKTHDYFSWASDNAMVPAGRGEVGEKKPDFVVKSDDDSFVMLGELEKRLRVLRGRKVYWGYLIKNLFMGGECYALSLDLVHYVATSVPVRQLIRGAEDKLVARWMHMHPEKETILWASESCWMYDHPRAGTVYSHGFLYPSTAREIQTELLTLDSSTSPKGGSESGSDPAANRSAASKAKGRKKADSLSYTSVSQFGKEYRPPLPNMTPLQRVEALIEGSEMSLLSPYSSVPDTSPLLPETVMARRPSIDDRYLGQWKAGRWGAGTVVVHYVKEREWFLETALAFERLGGGMGNEGYQVREGRKVETVHEVQHVAGVDAEVEDPGALWKRAAADPLAQEEPSSREDEGPVLEAADETQP